MSDATGLNQVSAGRESSSWSDVLADVSSALRRAGFTGHQVDDVARDILTLDTGGNWKRSNDKLDDLSRMLVNKRHQDPSTAQQAIKEIDDLRKASQKLLGQLCALRLPAV